MSFAQPLVLWGLAGPVLAAVTLVVLAVLRRRRSWTRWPGITRVVAVGTQVHPVGVARGTRRPWLLLLALTLALVALAGPRWGTIEEPVYQRSREVMLALDLSRSMLVQDVLPSRLERSRLLVRSLLDGLKGERVGLIVFAGTAFVQVPMSTDYQILEEFLTELNPEYMPQGGTDYDGMLRAALGGFSTATDTDRYLIVLSDGEAQDGGWRGQVAGLNERGIHVIGLGVGTVAGGFIPDPKTGAFVKDGRGAVVLSKLEPATLQALASETGGTYRDASAWVDLASVLQETVERGRQGQFTEQRAARAIERFQWFLGPALLCALLGVWREIPIRPRARQVRPAAARQAAARSAATMATALLLCAGGLVPSRLDAAVEDTTPASAADKLRATVTRLAAADSVAPAGWKAMAEQTLALGQETLKNQQPLEPGLVRDGLAAVDAGERLDPRAADWPALRQELRRLLEPPPEQQQDEQQNQDQPQKQDQPQDKQQEQQQQQQSQDQQQQDQGQPGEQKQDSQQKQQPQQQQDPQNQPGEPSKQEPSKEGSGFDQQQPPSQPPGEPPSEQQPQAAAEPPKTRKFGGQQDARHKQSQENPELAAALSRLEQVQENDSPARLHQRMEEESRRQERQGPPPANSRDW